jgi:3-oxoacyl-[acyl-carrier protein] reductase
MFRKFASTNKNSLKMNINGKNAIVTGGGRGLGKAVALALANEGVNVAITGRNEENLKMVVDEIQKLGVKSAYAVFSIDNEIHVKAGIESLRSNWEVDILINNAGIGDFGSIEEMPSETWEQVIKTNLFGVYYAAKAVYPFMKEKGEGDIVNVASTAGLKGGPNMSAYAASKAAVVSLSQSMMAEWRKQNIRVITLTPSTIASDMSIQEV